MSSWKTQPSLNQLQIAIENCKNWWLSQVRAWINLCSSLPQCISNKTCKGRDKRTNDIIYWLFRATQGWAILKQDMASFLFVQFTSGGNTQGQSWGLCLSYTLMNTFPIAKAIIEGQDGFCVTRTWNQLPNLNIDGFWDHLLQDPKYQSNLRRR